MSKMKLSNYLKNSLMSTQESDNKFEVKKQNNDKPNENYLDELFSSQAISTVRTTRGKRMSRIAMYAHPEGREPEPERKVNNEWFKGSMLAMMIAAVMITGSP